VKRRYRNVEAPVEHGDAGHTIGLDPYTHENPNRIHDQQPIPDLRSPRSRDS